MTLNRTVPRTDNSDLCAQEPIRFPDAVQPHGALVVVDRNLRLLRYSENVTALLDLRREPTFMAGLESLLGDADGLVEDLKRWIAAGEKNYLRASSMDGRRVFVSGHCTHQGFMIEFEPANPEVDAAEAVYPPLMSFLDSTASVGLVTELGRRICQHMRALTGFHRVMVYRFDADWNGAVIAEDGDGVLPSYLDLRFPASDIPAQARELYRLSRLRMIPTTEYRPVRILPEGPLEDGSPLDLSFATLRSVSPVHLEYMRNMGTAASMSISIVIDDSLWGLISCHHAQPKTLDPKVRAACDLFGRLASQQIASLERALENEERLRLTRLETELVAHLARGDSFRQVLQERAAHWLAVANADGASVVLDGSETSVGPTPGRTVVLALADWLFARKTDSIFVTDCLSELWPPGESIADVASGVLAVSISRIHPGFIIWFRSEIVRTVTWGGDPRDKTPEGGRLHPRSSFTNWTELVRRRSSPWREAEKFSALDFRRAVINLVLQTAEERAQLTDELQRTNKELEAFSYSISHDLRAPFRHIAGYAELLAEEEGGLKPLSIHYLDGIKKAALSAGQLVDDLLHFSQLGRASLKIAAVDMRKIVDEVIRSLPPLEPGRIIDWRIGELPPCEGDPALLRQAMFNLIQNAVKYSRDSKPSQIRIWGAEREIDVLYGVEDNGVGFDMAYASKLFQVFQRLHRPEDFDGTGIGLALTKRIVERHGGTTEAKGEPGKGATFLVVLPKRKRGT